MSSQNTEFTLHLHLVEDRLSETWEALSVQHVLNEHANKKRNPQLNSVINTHLGFWRVINFSLQSSIFIGLFALLDEGDRNASMYSILEYAERHYPSPSLGNFRKSLDIWRDKYRKHRNKIFGHNDARRNDQIKKFNAAGFTWSSLENDLAGMDHIWKTIWLLHCGNTAPTEEQSKAVRFPHNNSRDRVIEHTISFLKTILPKRKTL